MALDKIYGEEGRIIYSRNDKPQYFVSRKEIKLKDGSMDGIMICRITYDQNGQPVFAMHKFNDNQKQKGKYNPRLVFPVHYIEQIILAINEIRQNDNADYEQIERPAELPSQDTDEVLDQATHTEQERTIDKYFNTHGEGRQRAVPKGEWD